jgi:predicted nucleic acid-binding protein
MKTIFVDTQQFIGRINPRDQWHEAALEAEENIGDVYLVTTETVLHEVLNYFADFSPHLRAKTAFSSIN